MKAPVDLFTEIMITACGNAPSGLPGADIQLPQPMPRLSQAQANDVTLYAFGLVGTPYRYGGNTPETGFDCSGLIGHVYRASAGLAPPRTVAALPGWGGPVSQGRIRSGDLVIFADQGTVTHAGVYVGEGRFVHAPRTGGVVRLELLASVLFLVNTKQADAANADETAAILRKNKKQFDAKDVSSAVKELNAHGLIA